MANDRQLRGRVMIVDDDEQLLFATRFALKNHFLEIATVHSQDELRNEILRNYEVIVLDMNLSPGATSGAEGLYWLQEIRRVAPGTNTIVSTAFGDMELAVRAMKLGAMDFITKPWTPPSMIHAISNALPENASPTRNSAPTGQNPLIYASLPMKHIIRLVGKVAPTDANVLLLGENGTGKDILAQEIHRQSNRKDQPFVKVDLGALSESLFESELFGHVKGAFTDAKEDRKGRFESAQGGTLFLDEVGNIGLPLQAKLLTALQNRTVTPLGSNKVVPIDVRLICATNKPLYDMMALKEFREDLFYRIKTVEIELPALRDRREDIILLAQHFLKLYKKQYQSEGMSFTDEVLEALKGHSWPGNIRELQHVIERTVIMASSDRIYLDDLQLTKNPTPPSTGPGLKQNEKVLIEQAILSHNGNLTRAAQALGIGRSTLYRKMEKYQISRED